MPSNAPQAMRYFREELLPEILQGTNLKPDQVELRPSPSSTTDRHSLQLYFVGTAIPALSGEEAKRTFSLQKISEAFANHQIDKLTKPERDKWSQFDATPSAVPSAISGQPIPNFQQTPDAAKPDFSIDAYMRDRPKLTPEMRSKLDPQFSQQAQQRYDLELNKLNEILHPKFSTTGIGPGSNRTTLTKIEADDQRYMLNQQQPIVDQWRALATVTRQPQ